MSEAIQPRATILTVIAIAAILAGVAFRFYHLGAHGFWGDEGVTALHVAGYTQDDVVAVLTGPNPVTAGSVSIFHMLGDRGVGAVVTSLAREDPQHPPEYYILAHFWEQITGSQFATLRAFSALISLLLLPAIFWLTMELFSSRPIAWTATAIAALSPFNIEYAQQAREYALWIVMICVSSALLLRNLRSAPSFAWWAAYTASVVIGTYAHLFFVLVIIAHCIYALAMRRTLPPRLFTTFGVALGAAIILCIPWFLVSANVHATMIRYGNPYGHQSLKGTIYAWTVALATPFIDLEFLNLRYFAGVAIALVLELVSFVALIRTTRFSQWFFLACLTGSSLLLQLGNGGLTDMPRYLAPTIIGIQITVAWWLANTILTAKLKRVTNIATLCLFIALLTFAAFDDTTRAQTDIWWTNIYGAPLRPVAHRIDTSTVAPLIIGDAGDWEVLEDEAAVLNPNDRIWITNDASAVRTTLDSGTPVYLFSRHSNLATRFSRYFNIQPISIQIPARGDAMLQLHKRATSTATIPILWLWQLRK